MTQFVKQKMAECKGYSRVFLDFIKMITGTYSKSFLADEWGGNVTEYSQ